MAKIIHKLNDVSIGDVVTLVSGGPDLTVVGFSAPEPRPDFVPAGATVVEDAPVISVAWFTSDGVFGQGRLPFDAVAVKTKKDKGEKTAPTV